MGESGIEDWEVFGHGRGSRKSGERQAAGQHTESASKANSIGTEVGRDGDVQGGQQGGFWPVALEAESRGVVRSVVLPEDRG